MKTFPPHPARAARKARLIFAALLLASAAPLLHGEDNTLTPAEIADGWKLLFNGKDLSGWKGSKEKWSVENGAITNTATTKKPAEEGQTLVWQGGQISDFELSYQGKVQQIEGENRTNMAGFFCVRSLGSTEFAQAVARGPRAGFFREGPSRSYVSYPWGKKLKLSDSDNPRKPTIQETGTTGDTREMETALAVDDWNDYKIIALGNRLRSFAAGKEVCDLIDETSNAPKKGYLALRIYSFAKCTLQFKDIKLKVLGAGSSSQSTADTTPSSPPAPRPAMTGPGQLKVLSDQFLGAKEWTLARLDLAVPGAVADEIGTLKAALAAESALNAQDKDAQDSYKVGVGLCDALSAILKLREQAYQQAGGSAVHAPGADGIQQWDRSAKIYGEQLRSTYARLTASLIARGARQFIVSANPPTIVIPPFAAAAAGPAAPPIPPLPPPAEAAVVKPAATPAPTPDPNDLILGRWRLGNTILVLSADGTFENSAPNYRETGRWKFIGTGMPRKYQLDWSDGRKIEEFYLSGDQLRRSGIRGIVIATRVKRE
jgi:hypothetical protein